MQPHEPHQDAVSKGWKTTIGNLQHGRLQLGSYSMGVCNWEIIAGRLQSGNGCIYDYEEEGAAGVAHKEVFFAFWAPPQVSSKSIQKHIKKDSKND